ncbi:unnamed protein product, partial [Musa acuminata var. zebrina]
HLRVHASYSSAFTLSTPRVGQDSDALDARFPAVGAEKRRERRSEREGRTKTNAYRAYREPDKKGEKRSRTTLLDITSLSLAFFSFHHIRIHWPFFLDGSQPSERKKKREIPESDPFHALKSFSAVTDNDS